MGLLWETLALLELGDLFEILLGNGSLVLSTIFGGYDTNIIAELEVILSSLDWDFGCKHG
jgi:hypothetical protein